jgi:hypothetical protein
MVAARTLFGAEPAVSTLVLSVATKGVLLVDRAGAAVTSIAPALRAGYIATAATMGPRGELLGLLTSPLAVCPRHAASQLVGLALTSRSMGTPAATVGLVSDDAASEIVRGALGQLRSTGDVPRWSEVLDPGYLRVRLERILGVIEPSPRVRDELLSAWDLSLTFQVHGVDDVIHDLERRRGRVSERQLAALDAFLDFLGRHRRRANYGELRRLGIEIPIAARRRDEHLPVRMARARCRPITVEL